MATFDFIRNSHHKFFKLQENELIVAEERLDLHFLMNLEILLRSWLWFHKRK